jgi:hypothetical protein
MKLEFNNLDWEDAAQISGYVWALTQPPHTELDEFASFHAHFEQFVKGTELEEDPPTEANRAMSLAAWERGVEHAKNLLRADSFISVGEAAERARVDPSYIKAEIQRGNLYAQKIGSRRTSGYAIHPDDFRKWMENPKRGSRSNS